MQHLGLLQLTVIPKASKAFCTIITSQFFKIHSQFLKNFFNSKHYLKNVSQVIQFIKKISPYVFFEHFLKINSKLPLKNRFKKDLTFFPETCPSFLIILAK